jgi:gamma-glutamyltranspeptidase
MFGLLDGLHEWPPDFLSVDCIHAFGEAGRIAEADRSDSVGDPDVENVSVGYLLDRKYLEQRAQTGRSKAVGERSRCGGSRGWIGNADMPGHGRTAAAIDQAAERPVNAATIVIRMGEDSP